jgi:hypothetical protein
MRSQAYIHSIGAQEKLWACRQGSQRLASVSEVFFPAFTAMQADADGTPVLPVFETPWYQLGEEGRKRVRFAYLSYDIRTVDPGVLRDPSIAMNWRGEPLREGDHEQYLETIDPQEVNGEVKAALAKLLEVGYVTSPQVKTYTVAGNLPETTKYGRRKLPVGKHPYGIAFRVRQTSGSFVTRIYDLAIESSQDERSRI